jgi:hypothetical protein
MIAYAAWKLDRCGASRTITILARSFMLAVTAGAFLLVLHDNEPRDSY